MLRLLSRSDFGPRFRDRGDDHPLKRSDEAAPDRPEVGAHLLSGGASLLCYVYLIVAAPDAARCRRH